MSDHDDVFTPAERAFMRTVQKQRGIGYGRMMQLISYEWACDMHEQGFPVGGVFAPTCLVTLPDDLQDDWWAGLRSDPLFKGRTLPRREEGDDE